MTQLITSAANATLKRLRSLHEKKYRRQEGLFLAEGLRICTEALDAGWVPEILVFATGKGDHPLVRRLQQATAQSGGTAVSAEPCRKRAGKGSASGLRSTRRARPSSISRRVIR